MGEELGEPLDNDERSEEALLIDTSWTEKDPSQHLNEDGSQRCLQHHDSNAQAHGEHVRDSGERGGLTSVSVKSLGQNSMSSSRSKDRLASNCDRKALTVGDSTDSSLMLFMPRNCFGAFCDTDTLGALLFRPPWWLCDTEGAGAVG